MQPETISALREAIIAWIIIASSIALHEYGHAKSADKLGDPLPRSQGRVTLNPLAHLDPIGTGLIPLAMLILPIFMGGAVVSLIGWGKPVMVDVGNFPREKRTRYHLISVAFGPLMNVLIALVAAVVMGIFAGTGLPGLDLLVLVIQINVALLVFNLLPIPPLDGSHFLRYATGMSQQAFMRFSGIGALLLLVAINIPAFRMVFAQLIFSVMTPFFYLALLIEGLF